MAEEQSYVGQKPDDVLYLDVFPGEGQCEHYLDNGEDFAYEQGAYHLYRFTVHEDGQIDTDILHEGYDKPYKDILVRCGTAR